jgi:hypothetical protein
MNEPPNGLFARPAVRPVAACWQRVRCRRVALDVLDARGLPGQGLSRRQDETGHFALDRRRAIVQGIAMPAGAP